MTVRPDSMRHFFASSEKAIPLTTCPWSGRRPIVFSVTRSYKGTRTTLIAASADELPSHLANGRFGAKPTNHVKKVDSYEPPTFVAVKGKTIPLLDQRAQGHFFDQPDNGHSGRSHVLALFSISN